MKYLMAGMLCLSFILLGGCGSKEDKKGTWQAPQVIVGNELAVKSRLQAIAQAELMYQAYSGGNYATLDQLIDHGMLTDPSHGKLRGYKIEIRVKENGFEATAVPNNYGITGRLSFYIDESKILRQADKGGAEATVEDPQG